MSGNGSAGPAGKPGPDPHSDRTGLLGLQHGHDADLIESYVFEINALQSRYSYLLRRVKELDGERTVKIS